MKNLFSGTLSVVLAIALCAVAPAAEKKGAGKTPVGKKAAAPAKKAPAKTPKKPAKDKPAGKTRPAKTPAAKEPAESEKKKPAPPVYVPRDVPPPPVPTLTDVPAGAEPDDWLTWTKGQEPNPVRRLLFHLEAGFCIMGTGMAGNGEGAPDYTELFHEGISGMATNISVGFALLPVVHVLAEFHFEMPDGGTHDSGDSGGPGTVSYDADENSYFGFRLLVRGKLPLFLWTLKKGHFSFSRSEELTGLLLWFQFGVGGAVLDSLSLTYYDGYGGEYEQDYWNQSFNFSFTYAVGLEVRWDWGGVTVSGHGNWFGTPDSAWPPNSDAEPLETFNVRFGFALYVI